MTKNEQLVRLVEAIVRKELKTMLPTILPKVIKEVMAGLIMESVTSDDLDFTPTPTPSRGNAHKRRAMMESYEEDEPQLAVRRPVRAAVNENLNLPTNMMTESGNVIPINPHAVPDFIVKAMNKNYSEELQLIDSMMPKNYD